MKNAVIDVGSNSVRLFYNGQKRLVNTQLAENLMRTGVLSEAAMQRTAQAIEDLASVARAEGATDVYAFGTEAVRAAANGACFVEIVRALGVNFEVIPAEREASLGFYGAYTSGTLAVLDIGGASTELAVGDERGLRYAHSMPLGSVRLKDYASDKETQFSYAKTRVSEYENVPKFDKLVSIGGSVSQLAAVKLAMEPYDPEVIHGAVMTYEDIEQAVDKILSYPPEERVKIRGLHPKKILVAPAGGLIALAVMDYLGVKQTVLSERDNLEGYAMWRGIEV